MKEISLNETALVSGGVFLQLYDDNSMLIYRLNDGEIFKFNDLQFTNRGYFDNAGKHLDAASLDYTDIHNGYKVEVLGGRFDQYYQLTPV
jgi:hypothetical protein